MIELVVANPVAASEIPALEHAQWGMGGAVTKQVREEDLGLQREGA